MSVEADRRDFAAEYVLGTLDAAERDEAEALINADTGFAALVRDWERRLGELSAMVEPVSPPPEIWTAIADRLAEITAPVTPTVVAAAEQPDTAQVQAADAGAAGTEKIGSEPDAAEPFAGEPAPAEAFAAEPLPPEVAETAGDAHEGPVVAVEPADAEAIEPTEPTNVVDLTRRLRRWRGGAVAFGTLAAALAAIVVTAALAPGYLPEPLRPRPEVRTVEVPRDVVRTVEVPAAAPGRFVAVLQSSANAPAFIITVDVAERNLTVRRVAAETQTANSYELWLISDRLQQPQSLGLIGTSEFTRPPTLANYDPDTIAAATFAVSLEPEGGSPTGMPTGPVLFSGKLVEAVPPTRAP